MFAIYKRELRSYLCGMIGCVLVAIILAFLGFFVTVMNISGQQPHFEYSLITAVSFWVFILVIPFVTMRSIAEERHAKTEQLLLSLPIPTHKIVLAKYLAMLTLVGIPMVISASYPLLFSLFSQTEDAVNLATAYNGWFMLCLMLAAMVAIGMFASSLVENQIIAALIAAGIFFAMFFMNTIAAVIPYTSLPSFIALLICAVLLGVIVLVVTKNSTAACIVTGVISVVLIGLYLYDASLFWNLFPEILSSLAFFDVFMNGGAYIGAFDLTNVVYYVSFAAVAVFLTVESVERRRYN